MGQNKVPFKAFCFSDLMVCINRGASDRGEPALNFIHREQIILKPGLEIALHIPLMKPNTMSKSKVNQRVSLLQASAVL